MNKYLNKVLIIDGSYTLHRSLNTPGLQDLQTSSGIKSGGVFGALRILQSEIKKFPGYFPIFCFDSGLSKRRIDLYPDYKSNRTRQEADALIAAGLAEKDEYLEEYRRQRSDLIEILKSFGIPSIIMPGWEGDDLMYILSNACEDGVIISDDKDMIQLVSPTIKIRRAMRDEIIEWDENDSYYHHPRFTIRKSIIGDGSDNIPQCAAGVGEKTADKIAVLIENEEFENYKDTLEEYIKNNQVSLCNKIQKVLDNWNQFIINYQLINLRLVEVPIGFEDLIKNILIGSIGHANIMAAYSLLGKYEMSTIFPDQIIGLLAVASSQAIKEIK